MSNNFMRTLLYFIILAATNLPALAQPASIDLPPDLARVLRDYEAAWTAHDPSALAPTNALISELFCCGGSTGSVVGDAAFQYSRHEARPYCP